MRIYQISAFFTGFQSSYMPILDINVRCLVPSASILTRDFLFFEASFEPCNQTHHSTTVDDHSIFNKITFLVGKTLNIGTQITILHQQFCIIKFIKSSFFHEHFQSAYIYFLGINPYKSSFSQLMVVLVVHPQSKTQ